MNTERKWAAIAPLAFTADGGECGQVTLASTVGFKVKQTVFIKGDPLPDLQLEVKAVQSDTVLEVGAKGNIQDRQDLTLYTTAANSTIEAPRQDRPSIPQKEYERAVYEEEPTMAKRVVPVDKQGNLIDECNPNPVAVQNDAFTKPWNKLTVTQRRTDGQPSEIRSFKNGELQQIATILYFDDGEFQDIDVVDA